MNNVSRSHSTPDTNACNQFIPQVVAHPVIRKKCVLQIMDGIRGVYQGGPFGNQPELVLGIQRPALRHRPRGLDHIEWRIVDAKRKEMGLPPVGSVGKLGDRRGARGVRHAAAAAYPAGGESGAGDLRPQVAAGAEAFDRPSGGRGCVRQAASKPTAAGRPDGSARGRDS